MTVAKIALSAAAYAIDRPYDYLVPEQLEGTLRPGMRAAVPFGKGNRVSDGIVLSIARREQAEPRLKAVLAQLDEERRQLQTEAERLAHQEGAAVICNPAQLWTKAGFAQKQAVTDALIEIIKVADGEIEIVWKI